MTYHHVGSPSIATPAGLPKGLARLFTFRRGMRIASRLGIALARWWGKPFRFGNVVVAVRHSDVTEVLARDLDFHIQPVDGPRFDQVGYHFILGMDRSAELVRERHALYAALAAVDMGPIKVAAAEEIDRRIDIAPSGFDMIQDYARPVAAATARAVFGIAPDNHTQFMDAARAIFGHCFLNFTGDPAITKRAQAAAGLLTGWIEAEIARRRAAGELGLDMMGHLLRQGASDDLTRRTLGGMLVGSIDTTATAVAKIISVLMADRIAMAGACRDAGDLARLDGWCEDALRHWPQTPLLARQAPAETTLGGVKVPAGAQIMMVTQAAMFDATAFPDPGRLRCDRPTSVYLHRGGGLHPCAGRGINTWQIAMLVRGLLRRKPVRLGRMRWAGPFPAHLPVYFEENDA